jgi:hypothetical protein
LESPPSRLGDSTKRGGTTSASRALGRLRRPLTAATALLVCLPACGSGDERLSKGEYEQRVLEIVQGRGQTATRLFGDIVVDSPRLEGEECAARAREFHETLDGIVANVEELRPPAEVEELHEDFVTAASDSVAAVGDAVDDVEGGEVRCGQPLNERIYGLPSTDRAVAAIERFHERGYLRFVLGE